MGGRTLTIGVPVFNEEEGILEFVRQIDAVAAEILKTHPGLSVDLLVVNDGSTDATRDLLENAKPQALKCIRMIHFSRNYGHTAAVCALVDKAQSDALILMDADLQDDPKILIEFANQWLQDGALSVRVVRGKRKEGILFAMSSKIFYWAYGRLSGLQSRIGIFGLYDRRVYEALRHFSEVARFHPGILSLIGFKTAYIELDRAKRVHGSSRVGFFRLMKLANHAIFSFSTVPVLVVTAMGILISLTSLLGGVSVVVIRLFTPLAIPGWASILSAQLFLTGLVIFSLGVIGQYIAIIVEEVKRRPKYFVESEKVLSFDAR